MRLTSSSDFGKLLRRYRLAAGLSQEALAERAQMSTNGIGALERGYRRTPQRETLALLASALALNDEQREEFEATAARSGPVRRGAAVTVGPWPDTAIVNLPLALTSFVGREPEVAEIAGLVGAHRMVTVTGTGGVGKTQIALHVGAALSDTADDSVKFIALAPIADPALVINAIASALGVQEVLDRSLIDTLIAYLKNKAFLLILDNCEHVIKQVAIVADALLAGCVRVRILATSREPLKAAGEYSYRLPSLTVPSLEAAHRLGAADATAYGAIALFVDRACAADHRFTLTDENAPTVADICRRLDGIPLAIELAAARVNLLSLKAISERLSDRFRILTGGERTALPRQQTMRLAIDWSYDLLSAQEQQFFDRFSAFPDSCTLATAGAVCGNEKAAEDDVFELLSSLVDKSLVAVDLEGGEERYRLLESFRQYARDKLIARGEHEQIARRHALAYLDFADRLYLAWNTTPEREWIAQANVELENWGAALEWALAKRGDVIVGQRLAARICDCGVFTSAERRRWVRAALELVEECTPPELVARLEYTEALIAAQLGERKVSLAAAERALVRFRELGDALRTAKAQQMVASSLALLERPTEAEPLLREALDTARSQADRHLEADVLQKVGWVRSAVGDFEGARASLTEALGLARAIGVESFEGSVVISLAENEFDAGNAETALQLTVDLLQNRAPNFENAAIAAGNVAAYLIALGRYDEARMHACERLQLVRGLQMAPCVANSLHHLALVALLNPRRGEKVTSPAHLGAARLLGFYEGRRTELGMSIERGLWQEHDCALVALREAIGADELEKLMSIGARMTEDEAIAQAQALE